jgi:hypothetical protein
VAVPSKTWVAPMMFRPRRPRQVFWTKSRTFSIDHARTAACIAKGD